MLVNLDQLKDPCRMKNDNIARQKSDRRGGDRRKKNIPVEVDRRKGNRRTQTDRRQTA